MSVADAIRAETVHLLVSSTTPRLDAELLMAHSLGLSRGDMLLRQRALVVGDKAERVWRFHENTLEALKELVQAAGLKHPGDITASHIVRRVSHQEVRLLSNVLAFITPGSLLDGDHPHPVYQSYWHLASADSFAPQGKLPATLHG